MMQRRNYVQKTLNSFVCSRFELSSKMREACLILKNHLNDDIKTLKSKEVVRSCMLLQAILSQRYTFNFITS